VVVACRPAGRVGRRSLQGWEQGRFVRFHGLAQWVGWLWPYAAMAWLLARMAGADEDWRAQGFPGAPTIGPMSYYKHHIFFCLNQRRQRRGLLRRPRAQAGFDRCKAQVKAAGLAGPGGVRVNKAGCLDRCAGGPVAVVYPDETWYTFVDTPTSTRSSNRT
jgi:hypothetical protein